MPQIFYEKMSGNELRIIFFLCKYIHLLSFVVPPLVGLEIGKRKTNFIFALI